MSDTTFVNGATLSDADWFNDVNRLHYTILGDPATASAVASPLSTKTTVASATTPDIFATTVGQVVDYTGTATCTGFVAAPQAGATRRLICAGAAVFTAGANMLIDGVASGSNLTCVANDIVTVVAVTTTQFRISIIRYAISPSSIRLSTSNGYGSTNTKIRRYNTNMLSIGTDITYADSVTNGSSFTINTAGIYFISCQDQFNADGRCGISWNSNQLTTSIDGITTSNALVFSDSGAANDVISVSATIYCAVGDVIRPHGDGATAGASTTTAKFTITRVA